MRTKDSTVSLIIPVYNEEHYITACLEAIAVQKVRAYEVIVVDNNSTDKTVAIAESYDFVTVLREPRQGRIYAQATGFQYASGAILGRIDADARIHPNWVEEVITHIGDAEAVTGRGWFYDAPWRPAVSALQVFAYQHVQKFVSGTYVLWGANMAIRKATWQRVANIGLAHPELDEDVIMSLELYRTGGKIRYCPEIQVDASLRRNQLGPIQLIQYLSTWPRDYWAVGMYGRSILFGVVTIATMLVAVPGALLAQLVQRMRRPR